MFLVPPNGLWFHFVRILTINEGRHLSLEEINKLLACAKQVYEMQVAESFHKTQRVISRVRRYRDTGSPVEHYLGR